MTNVLDPYVKTAVDFIHQEVKDVSFSSTDSVQSPKLYELQTLPADGLIITTVNGPIRFESDINDLEDPPERVFFLDKMPEANWDHPCAYLVVHRSRKISHVDESSPPSSRTNTVMREIDLKEIDRENARLTQSTY